MDTTDIEDHGYIKALYEIPVSDIQAVSAILGVYVLTDYRDVYCGSTKSIKRRFPETTRAKGLGKYFNYFSEDLLNLPSNVSKLDFMRKLEINTISALHTIIWGNGLPLNLMNINDVYVLPPAAWQEGLYIEYQLAIDIARTALFRMGIPLHMAKLPNYAMIMSVSPERARKANEAQWNNILAAELSARKQTGYSKPPLYVMHPS